MKKNENRKSSAIGGFLGRREFAARLGAGAVVAAVAGCRTATTATAIPYTGSRRGMKWFKGNTHMHTLRSDGDAFPAEAAALFKRAGYNFVCITDHNITSADPFAPIPVDSHKGGKAAQSVAAGAGSGFPGMEFFKKVRGADGRECYTSPSFGEIAQMLDEPGRFLVIGGNEVTSAPTAGKELHCNFLNYSVPCRARNLRTVEECLDWIRGEYARVAGDSRLSVMTLNHPLWVSYDVSPLLIAKRPDIKFFEVCNSGSMPRFELPGKEFTHDKWWDVVNAIRAKAGQPLIYGVASDDIHGYGTMRKCGKVKAGYVQVFAERLSTADIMESFHRGDFYSSTGLDLESVRFDPSTRTLSVTVDPAFGDDCTISFIGTKKDADVSVKGIVEWEIKAELNKWLVESRHFSRKRTVERFSPDIGSVFKSVKGRSASYTMQPDDLYVRAKIVSPASADTANREPDFPVAWTQPVRAF